MKLILGSVIFLIMGVCFFRISNHAVLLGRPVVRRSDRNWQITKSSLQEVENLFPVQKKTTVQLYTVQSTLYNCTQCCTACALCSLYWLPHSFTHEHGGNLLVSRLGPEILALNPINFLPAQVWSYAAVSTDCTYCTTLCTIVQCTLYCVQLYSRFLLNRK